MKKFEITREFNIDITEEEIYDFLHKAETNNLDFFKVADMALGKVSWHDSMPDSMKKEYISMLEKHLNEFKKYLGKNPK